MRLRTFLTVILFFALPFASQAGKLYKWVDDEGRTHYSDKVPPSDTHRARSHLDEHGITVKEVDAAKTEEELRQEAEQERLRQERQRLVEKQQAQDRVLLRTFRSEDDILMTRNGQVQAVDTYIRVTQANIKRLKTTLDEMQQRAAERELSGKPVSNRMQNDIETKRNALKDAYRSIINREHDKNRIRQSFARDLQRFRELKKLNKADNPVVEAQASFDDALQNVYDCQDDRACRQPWKLARQYLKTYSTTAVKMEGEHIIITGEPVEKGDISISMSRIEDPQKGNMVIFMDLQCKGESVRNNTCQNSPEVKRIKQGFQSALRQ